MANTIFDMRPRLPEMRCPQCSVHITSTPCWNCKWRKGMPIRADGDPFKYLKDQIKRKEEDLIPKKTMTQAWFDRLYQLTKRADEDTEKSVSFVLLREFILGAERVEELKNEL